MKKATGLDSVSARPLREYFDLISDSLALIFNPSIETSIFPDEWNSATKAYDHSSLQEMWQ